MTQCVQMVTQQTLLREAWRVATLKTMHFVDFRQELRDIMCRQQPELPQLCVPRWPVYLTVQLPETSPVEWRGIVGSRLMAVLLPQLQACGFFPRPLCVDKPSYMVLLWPLDSVWTTQSHIEFMLPLQDRILPCLFAMLETAYDTLWDHQHTDHPPLADLLPKLDIQLSDI